MIQLVPVLLVDTVWPQLIEGMSEACRRGGGQYTQDWLHSLCRKGEAYLVVDLEGETVNAAVVCQNQVWSGKSVLYLLACCGRPYRPRPFIDFAKGNFSFDTIVFEGRKGWGKLPGVRTVRHVFEMEV